MGDDNDVHSEKSSLPKFDTSVVIWHFFRSFERYNSLELPNYTKMRIIEALGPINTSSSTDAMVHRARPTAPPLVLMCYFRLDDIPKRAGTVCEAVGRVRCTTPKFGPLGGPASRPERANFEDRVRSRK